MANAAAPARRLFSPGQGRPLGFLLAWLRAGAGCALQAFHLEVEVTTEARQRAREDLIASPDPAARMMLDNCEREQFDYEEVEPLVFEAAR